MNFSTKGNKDNLIQERNDEILISSNHLKDSVKISPKNLTQKKESNYRNENKNKESNDIIIEEKNFNEDIEIEENKSDEFRNIDIQLYYDLCRKLYLIESAIVFLNAIEYTTSIENLLTQKKYLIECIKSVKKGFDIDTSYLYPDLNPFTLFNMDE